MAFQHHFNSPVAGIFSKIFSRHGFLAPYARPTNFLKVGRPWFSLVDIQPTVFFEILLLEHQKWVFPRVSRASFRISFNQTDWKCCRGKRISRTGRGAAEREREREKKGEREAEHTIVFHATWTRTRCHFFRGTVARWNRVENVGRNYTSVATEMPPRKNWSLDREKWTIWNWSEWTV